MRLETLKAMTWVLPAVRCELCREAYATKKDLCTHCDFDHQAAEFEGVELTREDLLVERVTGVGR
jgi:hypothetical protein